MQTQSKRYDSPSLWYEKHSGDWCLFNHSRIYIYGTKQSGTDYNQMGTYWRHFTPRGVLVYYIDFVCIAQRVAEINCVQSMPVELVSSLHYWLYSHPVSVSSAFEGAEPRELYRGKLPIKAVMSAVISQPISRPIMSGEGEVIRAEQYYPTICSLPPLGVSLLSAAVYLLYLAPVLSLPLLSTPPHRALSLSVNPLISSLYAAVWTDEPSLRDCLYCPGLIHHMWVCLSHSNQSLSHCKRE